MKYMNCVHANGVLHFTLDLVLSVTTFLSVTALDDQIHSSLLVRRQFDSNSYLENFSVYSRGRAQTSPPPTQPALRFN